MIKKKETRPKCPLCRIPFLFVAKKEAKVLPNWKLPFAEDDIRWWEIYVMVKEEKRKKEEKKGRQLKPYKLTCFEGDFMRRYVYCIEPREGYFYSNDEFHY